MVIGCVLRNAGKSYLNYADTLSYLELLNYYLTLDISSGRRLWHIILELININVGNIHILLAMKIYICHGRL